MMAKHTPGPWTSSDGVFPLNVYGPDPGAGPKSRRIIACCDIQKLAEVAGYEDTSAANARLIAAAPDLLNVCELLHVRLFREQGGQENSPWASPLRLLEAAIAKAKGA